MKIANILPPTEMRVRERFVRRKNWDESFLKIALIYPNVYSAGMGGYTIQLLYHLFNQSERALCERAFLPFQIPSNKINSDHPAQSIPPIRTLENQMPLVDFDILAFTLQYELDYPNLIWILENSKIPIFRDQRALIRSDSEESEKHWPLILVGGPCIRSNPLPIAKIIDLAFIGELEPVLEPFIQEWLDANSKVNNYSKSQNAFLDAIQLYEGFWRPKADSVAYVKRVYLKDLDVGMHPTQQIIPEFEPGIENPLPFSKTIFIEVNRGCPHGCRFCLTGHQVKPFRNRNLSIIKELIQTAIKETDVHEMTLIGASVTDHPQFSELCEFLIQNKIHFSIPSLRIETMTQKIAQDLVASGMKTIAIAPETGSDELRMRMNKCVTNNQILTGSQILFENGIQNLKLYFMYGLPFETDSDLNAMTDLIRNLGTFGSGKWSLRVSLNPFIPKAHTPFESECDLFLDPDLTKLKEKYVLIQNNLKGMRQVKLETLDIEEAYLQTIFSLGDERVTKFLIECYQKGPNIKKWFVLAKHNYFSQFNSMLKEIQQLSFGQRPWNFIDQGILPQFLVKEYQLSKNARAGIHCDPNCRACGICEDEED